MWSKILRNVKNAISRYLGIKQRFALTPVGKPKYYACGANIKTDSRSSTAKRWIYNSMRCEYCARVDHSKYLVTDRHILRECLYLYHDELPEGALRGDLGEIYVSPDGSTCPNFLSGAW